MNLLVEFKTPIIEDGEPTEEMETRTGILMHFGIAWTVHEESQLPVQFTVAIVQESESGQILEMSPSEIKVI